MTEVTYVVLEPGRPTDLAVRNQVVNLFEEGYFRYHYMSQLRDADRLRCLAVQGGAVIGFAAATTSTGHAYLANLFVRGDRRGLGVGRGLERVRYDWVRRHGLTSVVSCICEDLWSQQLKWDLGMRPVAVKYGYRIGVVSPDGRGSSVVYTDADDETRSPGGAPVAEDVTLDSERLRVRIRGQAAFVLDQIGATPDDHYGDILVSSPEVGVVTEDPRLVRAGVDWDGASQRWLHCFQLRNGAYASGWRARPKILAGIDSSATSGALR